MLLTVEESVFINWYRQLDALEKIAVRALLLKQDHHLFAFLRERGKCLNCPLILPAPERHDELAFLVGQIHFD